jgi:hypothetical protein
MTGLSGTQAILGMQKERSLRRRSVIYTLTP